jgi:hypothetical protein
MVAAMEKKLVGLLDSWTVVRLAEMLERLKVEWEPMLVVQMATSKVEKMVVLRVNTMVALMVDRLVMCWVAMRADK